MQQPAASKRRLAPLPALERDVLVRRGVRKKRDPGKPRLAHARADTVDEGKLPDRRKDRRRARTPRSASQPAGRADAHSMSFPGSEQLAPRQRALRADRLEEKFLVRPEPPS
jgi:hypothetical protein